MAITKSVGVACVATKGVAVDVAASVGASRRQMLLFQLLVNELSPLLLFIMGGGLQLVVLLLMSVVVLPLLPVVGMLHLRYVQLRRPPAAAPERGALAGPSAPTSTSTGWALVKM
jgi:hypothetical protein